MPLAGGSPTSLATGQDEPGVIVVDANNAYWSTASSVWKVGLGGGAPVTLTSGLQYQSLAVDATSLYVGAAGEVERVPLAGGTPVVLAAMQRNVFTMVSDATSVYWTTANSDSVMKLTLADGHLVQLYSNPSGACVYGIAIDATSVYFTVDDGTVRKVPLGGGPPVTLASCRSHPLAIAVDATSVYWTETAGDGTGSVMKVTPK